MNVSVLEVERTDPSTFRRWAEMALGKKFEREIKAGTMDSATATDLAEDYLVGRNTAGRISARMAAKKTLGRLFK